MTELQENPAEGIEGEGAVMDSCISGTYRMPAAMLANTVDAWCSEWGPSLALYFRNDFGQSYCLADLCLQY